MRKPIFVSMLVLGLMLMSGPAMAKNKGFGATKGNHDTQFEKLKGMLAQLDLTDDQKPKVDQILSDAQDKAQAIKVESKGGDKTAAKEKTKQLFKDTTEQLSKILTTEQRTKLRAMMKEAKAEKKSPTTQP